MARDRYVEEDLLEIAIRVCEKCSGQMKFKGSGRYVCEECGCEYYTAFGKVKKYLSENGPRNAFEISEATGVSRSKIYDFIREGRVEVAKNIAIDKNYCASCGVTLEFGTYCPQCAKRMKRINSENKGVYNMLLANPDNDGEMRFAGKEKK